MFLKGINIRKSVLLKAVKDFAPLPYFCFWFSSCNTYSFLSTGWFVFVLVGKKQFGADYFMSKPQIKLFGSSTRDELAIIFGFFFYGLVGLIHFRCDSAAAAFTHRLRLSFPKRGRRRFCFQFHFYCSGGPKGLVSWRSYAQVMPQDGWGFGLGGRVERMAGVGLDPPRGVAGFKRMTKCGGEEKKKRCHWRSTKM